ncbi:MAG: acyl-CoA carboxylase subunit beta [Burkholderiales bacterium]|nr:acyl-CoA carboxylase subunit beta [Burkholderiales bacterium]OJX08628.1 MAG: acetyl-CoA carboxylase carboxyltransferase subunit [Burkholderiales bacterium 70-64]
MLPLDTGIDTGSAEFAARRAAMIERIAELRALEQRTRDASARAAPLFERRGQLLPRERLARLLDAGSPWLELSTMAGYRLDAADPQRSIPGAGVVCGIGFVACTRCVVVVNDSGIDAGAIPSMGGEKILRAQQIAFENRLPLVQSIESAGANLLRYRVEDFVHGGRLFHHLARLSAAGIPVVAIVHGSSTAGGAYLPGLSDYVVMVRGRAKAFLAGPPLLQAATGEIATDEELGGAEMHATISGLADYLADDDADAVRIAREVVGRLGFDDDAPPHARSDTAAASACFEEPLHAPEELAGVVPLDFREPFDMREVIARIVDGSRFLEFQPDYGPQTVCGHAELHGHRVGIVTNNGPIDPAGANKATHFIQACCQSATALLYLQNTTGYIVGRASEQTGMIKHGSKMIQAVSNATVPSITLHCGASFGAGNYGMCGRSFGPRFVFSWPNTRTAVMGGEQAALTMRIVSESTARRRGEPVDEAKLDALSARIVEHFEAQAGVLHTSARLLDDGIVDPRDTRKLLGFLLDTCAGAQTRALRPSSFGVARP